MRNRQQVGMSLVEVLLVLAVATASLLAGVRQYQLYLRDVEYRQVQQNVDNIFQALGQFYMQNCNGAMSVDPNGDMSFKAGKLNPQEYNSKDPYQVKIDKDLQASGLLTQSIMSTTLVYGGPKANNPDGTPMIDITNNPSSIGTDGYVAQFNRLEQPRKVCLEGDKATGVTSDRGCKSQPVQVGINLIWKPQVAVRLMDEEHADIYLALLGGDCLSNAKGKIVLPCDQAKSNTGNYVVWERLPSQALQKSGVHFWQTAPTLKSFNQMYTTYPSTYLNKTEGKNPSGNDQYYLCGG